MKIFDYIKIAINADQLDLENNIFFNEMKN